MKVEMNDLGAQYRANSIGISAAIFDVINSTKFIGGHYVEKFENEFSKFVTGEEGNCVSCGNGTDALVIALKALGIGRGDEVIVPSFTFVATAEAVSLCGATPIFVDVDENGLMVRPEDNITPNTKAIIMVHLYGNPANVERCRESIKLSNNPNVRIIEDCAQAHGAEGVGIYGDVACFSFFPGKNLGCYGDGGAIISKDKELVNWMRMYKDHGRKEKYNHEFIGTNSRLDAIHAAVLSCKLQHLESENDHRRKVALVYTESFRHCSGFVNTGESVYHQFVVRVREEDRAIIMGTLIHNGVACAIHYPLPIPLTGGYAGDLIDRYSYKNALMMSKEVLSLPIHGYITDEQVEYVCKVFNEAVKK